MTFWDDVYELRENGKIERIWKANDLKAHLLNPPTTISTNPSNYSVTKEGVLDGGNPVKKGSKPRVWRSGGSPLEFELIQDPDDDTATQNKEVKLSLERAHALRSREAQDFQIDDSRHLPTHSSEVQSVEPDQSSYSFILPDTPRWSIAHEFARWCVRSALNSGKDHIKSREDVYAALDSVDFQRLFDSERGIIDQREFNDWHRASVDNLIMKYESKLNVGWAAKMIAIYLKTTCYLAGFGREGLGDVIHPPIDNNLVKELRKEFRSSSEVIRGLRSFKAISNMSFEDYDNIIGVFERIAHREKCTLFEVEQYFRPG